MKSKWDQLWESLKDPEYRRQFIDEYVSVGIAFQIRSLRNRQKKKQSELAEMLHVRQPQVCAWENPNYGNYSLNTLKALAKAFDVGLLVRFVPFSSLVDWEVNLTPDMIAPASFGEEQASANTLTLTAAAWDSTEGVSITDAGSPSFPPPYPQGLVPLASTVILGTPYNFGTPEKEKELAYA